MNTNEKNRVIEHGKIAGYADGVMTNTTNYCGKIFRRYMNNGSVLELGPAEGVMTDYLYQYYEDYTIVDGADFFVESITKRYPKIKGIVSLFEEFNTEKRFDNIILGHVLEHVEDPVAILKMCKKWLETGGSILAAVPNSHSIHRQAAVKMGMLDSESQLNETDHLNGHRRVYNMELLRKDFIDAGFNIKASGGYWLKPLSNGQINQYWNDEMIQAFLQLGEKYPDISGEIYIVANLR
ncbi:Methyltransferase domain-containing protein [Lachnospiraceae bacterium C7]|nr:Methyltransferase domain-containing protein [Lachnospiraceae bacterium C7]